MSVVIITLFIIIIITLLIVVVYGHRNIVCILCFSFLDVKLMLVGNDTTTRTYNDKKDIGLVVRMLTVRIPASVFCVL